MRFEEVTPELVWSHSLVHGDNPELCSISFRVSANLDGWLEVFLGLLTRRFNAQVTDFGLPESSDYPYPIRLESRMVTVTVPLARARLALDLVDRSTAGANEYVESKYAGRLEAQRLLDGELQAWAVAHRQRGPLGD